jgi:hypothetical protein
VSARNAALPSSQPEVEAHALAEALMQAGKYLPK